MTINNEKICPRCKRKLPLSEFYIKKSTGSYESYCKKCKKELCKQWFFNNKERHLKYQKKYNKNLKKLEDLCDGQAVGGYNITILNYTKKSEYKYNIVSTDGKSFFTNSKSDFLNFLDKI